MKKEINNSKGITLITLIITVMVLAILTSVAVYSGIEVLNSSKLTRFTTEMKLIQTRVNEIYDDRDNYENKGQDASSYATQLSSIATAIGSDFTTWGYSSDISNYRYYTKEKLKEDLDIEDVEQDVLIDLYNRKIISVNGTTVDGQTYYVLEQLPNSVYNVEYEDNLSVLPKEYQALEYIQSSGTQYIDLGILPTMDTKVLLEYQFLSITGSNDSNQIGCGKSLNNFRFMVNYPKTTDYFIFGVGNNLNTTHVKDSEKHLFTIDMVNKECKIDDEKYSFNINNLDTTDTDTFTLFARKSDGTIHFKGESRFYSLKFYNGNTLIRDFVPCYSLTTVTNSNGNSCPNGTIGVYDLVENKFYTNNGTGTFIKGPKTKKQITPTFNVGSTYLGDDKFRFNVSNISNNYGVEKWTVKYKKEGQDYWNTSKDLNFVVNEDGKYKVKIVNGNIESEEKEVYIAGLPKEFKQVEYIESTGTQ